MDGSGSRAIICLLHPDEPDEKHCIDRSERGGVRHRNVSLLGSAIGIERYGSIALSYDRNSLLWLRGGHGEIKTGGSPIPSINRFSRSPQHLVSSPSNPNRNPPPNPFKLVVSRGPLPFIIVGVGRQ